MLRLVFVNNYDVAVFSIVVVEEIITTVLLLLLSMQRNTYAYITYAGIGSVTIDDDGDDNNDDGDDDVHCLLYWRE